MCVCLTRAEPTCVSDSCHWETLVRGGVGGEGEGSRVRDHVTLSTRTPLLLSELGWGCSSPDELSFPHGFTGGIPGQSVVSGRPAERLVGTVNVKRSARTTPSCALAMATPTTV